ncbi:MAG: hypothetical protein ACYCZQ_03270 [Burkholderiales bacterium]
MANPKGTPNYNLKGTTVEYREALYEKQCAEAKARNMEKRREQLSKARASAGTARHYNQKNSADQVELALTQFLKQFINEIKGKPLLDVNFTDKTSVSRRKDQLVVIKDMMAVIRQMRELKELLADDEADGKKENPLSADNLVLMDQAKELLASKKIKADI